jgi:phage tail sheath gpL-like
MASPNISFDTIPSSIRKPGAYVEFNTRLAVRTLPTNKQRLLMLGQKLAAGTAAAGAPVKVYSDVEAGALFGRGSMLHCMVAAAINANQSVDITAVPFDDPATAVASTAYVDFAGTNAQGGSITLTVAGRSVEISLTNANPVQVANAFVDLITARPDWPVTASATLTAGGAVLLLVAKNKGTAGNDLSLDISVKTTGITAIKSAFAGGAVELDITGALSALYPASEEILVVPWVSQMGWIKTHVDQRSGSTEQRGAISVYGMRTTLATATSQALTANHGRSTIALLPASATPGYELAAMYAATIASEEDPARPLNGLPLIGAVAPNLASRLTRTEQEACLANGVTPLVVGPGEQVQIVRAVTTYTTNAAGTSDISLLDLTTIRTLDYCRKAWRDRIALRFPREKKTAEVKRQVRSELLDVAYKLEELGIIENVEANKAGFIVEDDSQDPNRLNVRLPTDVVNGLHVFAARIDLLL